MVGYSIRKGAGGQGGLRFQILAVVLTYLAVALAYTPVVISQVRANAAKATTAGSASTSAKPVPPPRSASPSAPRAIVGVAILVGLFAALPIMIVAGSMPSGLISAIIIIIGMRQAWRMTAAPRFDIQGPYRVGAAPAPV
jgi:hypothetical protein